MWIAIAPWIVFGFLAYCALGLLFAIAFVTLGVQRIDSAAPRASLGFRLLLLPGSTALWPILLARWLNGSQPSTEANAHRLEASRPSP